MSTPSIPNILEQTLQLITDRVLNGTAGDMSLVCLRLESGVYRIKTYTGDFPPEVIPDLDFRAGEAGVGAQVAGTGEPRLIGDYRTEISDSPFLPTSRRVGARSIVCVAIGPPDDVIAVIYLMSRTPNRFTDQDMRRMVMQAEMAEIALRLAMS